MSLRYEPASESLPHLLRYPQCPVSCPVCARERARNRARVRESEVKGVPSYSVMMALAAPAPCRVQSPARGLDCNPRHASSVARPTRPVSGPLNARKVDPRLPEKGNSNSHGARPVHQIISMIKRIWTRRLSIKNPLSPLNGVANTPFTFEIASGEHAVANARTLRQTPFCIATWEPHS